MTTRDSTPLTKRTSAKSLSTKNAELRPGNNGVEVDRRRLFGAFYTPDSLAEILVRWALKGKEGTILDPSFGGCAFLTAAVNELERMGVSNAGRYVHGVDVDPDCIEYVRGNDQLVEANCTVHDFLDLSPSEIGWTPFKAIVGNPPFVRHHWLKGGQRAAARSAIDMAEVKVPATASTWAYFLVHSFAFLDQGGRLAMLVPEAILQADYSKPIRKALSERFGRVMLVHIRDRLFKGTDEPVVVVAAADYGRPGKPGKIAIDSIDEPDDLADVLTTSTHQRCSKRITIGNARTVHIETIELLKVLEQLEQVRRVSEVATVRIGFVTGANNHFIRSLQELKNLGIPSQARVPVVGRTRWLSGLDFTKEDHSDLAAAGQRAFLVRPTRRHEKHAGIIRWIEEGEAVGVDGRFKCSRRAHWFRVELPKVPDAFATCTRLGSPLIIINRASVRCSNALHSIYWLPKVQVDPEAIAVGYLTSAASVWAELHGRRYGGGVLKTEPGKLGQTPVPMLPASADAYDELNDLMRAGREEDARLLADRVVLEEGLGFTNREIRRLQNSLKDLMSQRIPKRLEGRNG